MKSILLISSVYPGPDIPRTFTPVVHYFAKSFSEKGYDIRVITTQAYYPKIFYKIPQAIKRPISSFLGFSFPIQRLDKEKEYELDGIKVYRLPTYKRMPMGRFSTFELENKVEKILSYLTRVNYNPDIIVGHWINPQLFLVSKLGDILNVKTSIIAHEQADNIKLLPEGDKLIKKINVWGFRNKRIKDSFYQKYSIGKSFICHSGIPEIFLLNTQIRNCDKDNRFTFIGHLVKRKYPDICIEVLSDIFKDGDFTLNIVGDGPMMKRLRKLTKESNLDRQVNFTGRIERNKVIDILDETDIFIMISRNEVFGLVYLEAMARGCIVIASKNEGMDGIIESGRNGFLITAGDKNSLKECIVNISLMTSEQRHQISNNAMNTAKEFSDSNAAEKYLQSINS